MSRFKSSQLYYIFQNDSEGNFTILFSLLGVCRVCLDLRCMMCYNLTVPALLLFREAMPY